MLAACLSPSAVIAQPGPGSRAPEIRLTDIEGKPFLLSEWKGQVVLVDFWASWCMPCRVSNRSLVRLHKKFSPKGLQIVSVSVDEDRQAWARAVKTDKLSWNQVVDVPTPQSASAAYGVRYIPNAFLIDKKGFVRDVDASGRKLEKMVEQLLSE